MRHPGAREASLRLVSSDDRGSDTGAARVPQLRGRKHSGQHNGTDVAWGITILDAAVDCIHNTLCDASSLTNT